SPHPMKIYPHAAHVAVSRAMKGRKRAVSGQSLGFSEMGRYAREHSWLAVVLGAGLVFAGAVDFRPPAQVRSSGGLVSEVVGDAPKQEFAAEVGHTQAVQLRATLRRYVDPSQDVLRSSPEVDAAAQLLSSPVVTTIYGMQATIEQTIKLPGVRRELDVSVKATPRKFGRARRGKPPEVVVDHELSVRSRKIPRWYGAVEHRQHVRELGKIVDIEARPHRIVFSVDEELFSLDLELRRAQHHES
ncbi:MAG: hypothetical protein ACPHRO_04790, partial [Nannocystaceae bacterium]